MAFHYYWGMRIARTSPFTSNIHILDLPVTEEEIARWKAGELIQNVWPHLTPDQREFIKTGITAEEWARFVPDV